jgi:hypothetical protein
MHSMLENALYWQYVLGDGAAVQQTCVLAGMTAPFRQRACVL